MVPKIVIIVHHTYMNTYPYPADPDWADINFGVFICIECSGIHRSLGAHLTKVKSVNLDEWSEDHVKVNTSSEAKVVHFAFFLVLLDTPLSLSLSLSSSPYLSS